MAEVRFNFVFGSLASSLTSGATTMVNDVFEDITLGVGDWFYVALDPRKTAGDPEIIKVTAVTGDTATIDRGEYGTTARAHAAGTKWIHGLLREDIDFIWDAIEAIEVYDDSLPDDSMGVLDPDTIDSAVDAGVAFYAGFGITIPSYVVTNTKAALGVYITEEPSDLIAFANNVSIIIGFLVGSSMYTTTQLNEAVAAIESSANFYEVLNGLPSLGALYTGPYMKVNGTGHHFEHPGIAEFTGDGVDIRFMRRVISRVPFGIHDGGYLEWVTCIDEDIPPTLGEIPDVWESADWFDGGRMQEFFEHVANGGSNEDGNIFSLGPAPSVWAESRHVLVFDNGDGVGERQIYMRTGETSNGSAVETADGKFWLLVKSNVMDHLGSIHDVTDLPWLLGYSSAGERHLAYVEVYDGVDGTLRLSAYAADADVDDTSFTDRVSGTWTGSGTAIIAEDVVEPDANTVLNGAGAPDSGLGADGDFYIDTTADAIYGPKTAGAWGTATSLIGPPGTDGEDGLPGTDGEDGLPGVDGDDGQDGVDGKTLLNGAGAPDSGLGVDGDFYIDTTADAIYGPKTAGAWGSSTSLIGPPGQDGEDGIDGGGGGITTPIIVHFTAFSGTTYNTAASALPIAALASDTAQVYIPVGEWAIRVAALANAGGPTAQVSISGTGNIGSAVSATTSGAQLVSAHYTESVGQVRTLTVTSATAGQQLRLVSVIFDKV